MPCNKLRLTIAHSLINRNGERVEALKKAFCGKKEGKMSRKGLLNDREIARRTLSHMQPHDKVLTATRTHEYKLTCPNHIKLALNYAQKSKSKQKGDFPRLCCPPLKGRECLPSKSHLHAFYYIRLRDVDFGQSVARFLSPAHDL